MMRALGRRGPFAGWPAAAIALVDAAAERHGGWARWSSLSAIDLTLTALGGPLPRLKGLGRTHAPFGHTTVWPHECRVAFHDYAGGEALFDRGDVRAGGVESRDHRRSFDGWRKHRRWSPVDAVYFFGYALANYLAQPFLLSHARFLDAGPDHVRVEFDADWPAHCRRQRFWFRDGLLVRHDYVAAIVGRWAHGAHFTSDHVEVAGLWVPRVRRVTACLGRWATPVPVLHARFGAIVVR